MASGGLSRTRLAHLPSAHLDPAERMIGILMTQRMMDSPVPPKVFGDFWTSAYRAIDD